MVNLGALLRESGRVEEAEQWWRRATDTEQTRNRQLRRQ